MKTSRTTATLQRLLIPALVIIGWEISTQVGVLDTRFFIPLSEIAVRTVEQLQTDRLPTDLLTTTIRLLVAFAFAAMLGVLIGLASGYWRRVELILKPLVDTIYPLPKIAILPLLIIIVGRGEAAFILTAFATGFFQIMITTRSSVKHIDPQLVEAGRNFGATGPRFFIRVLLPGIASELLHAFRLGMATCLISLVVVEYVGAEIGLGAMIRRAGQQFAVDQIYSGILIIGILGLLITGLFRGLERVLVPWKAQDEVQDAAMVPSGV